MKYPSSDSDETETPITLVGKILLALEQNPATAHLSSGQRVDLAQEILSLLPKEGN